MHNIISHHASRTKYIRYILLMITICINSYIWSADDTYPTLNRAVLHKKITKYEQLSQEKKNNALLAIVDKGGPDCSYPQRRVKIAALVHAGADVPAVQAQTTGKSTTLLPNVVLMGDLELTELLVNNKANINEQTFDKDTAIHLAKTVKFAQLLLRHGALEHLNAHQTKGLIARLAWPRYSPELIPLYKRHDFNILACDNTGYTLLMNLPIWTDQKQDMIKKAKLLLEGLTIEQVKQFLAIKNNHHQTVFNLIDDAIARPYSDSKYLYALRKFLAQRIDPEKYPDNPPAVTSKINKQLEVAIAECPICLEALDEKTCTTTPCNHTFHTGCLNSWINQNHSCPLCRSSW